jgi:hypothetical protein
MSISEYQKGRIARAKTILYSIAYLFICYVILPHGWEVSGQVSVLLFALFLYADTSSGKFLSLAGLAANIVLVHSHITKPDYYIFSPTHDPDSIVYLWGFISSFGFCVAVMLLDILVFEKRDRQKDNPALWVVVFLALYVLAIPPYYRFAFLISCPFAICAYKCRGAFRTISFLAIVATTAVFRTKNYFHLQFPFFLAFGSVFVSAYCLYLGNVAFAHEQLEKRR